MSLQAPGAAAVSDADAERRRGLRRMKSVAASLLVLAATGYLLTLHRTGWLGFVNARARRRRSARRPTGSP